MNKQPEPIPKFTNEARERAYWESHDSTEHLDWSKARKATLANLKPTTKTISLRLPQHLLDSLKVASGIPPVGYPNTPKNTPRGPWLAIGFVGRLKKQSWRVDGTHKMPDNPYGIRLSDF